MKRDNTDFFHVEEHHLDIHTRLINWSRYVSVRPGHWVGPIWRLGKSNGRQWEPPAFRPTVDTLDGHKLEKAVQLLPGPHRDVLRWCYVFPTHPHQARTKLGVTNEGLMRLLHDARVMLINRRV